MKRPLVVAVIGYIIGIIIGLYFKFSIVLFYINFIPIGVVIHFINKRKKRKFRLFSIRRYFRYIKIYLNHKIILVIILLSIISNSIVLYKNKKYNFVYKLPEKIEVEATVVSNKQEKEYKNIYKIIYDIRGFGMKTTEPTAGCGRFRGKVFYKKLINRFWRPRRAAEDLQRLF